MNQNLTEIVCILDASGSMSGLEQDTIGGFEAMVKRQQKEEGECLLNTLIFNNHTKVIHDRIRIEDVPLQEEWYCVGGGTALIDAIGGAIHHVKQVHRYIRKEDVPAHTIFMITTDGMENASHQYTSNQVKKMIEQQKKEGWEFIFLGANIDAVQTAERFGINQERTVNYHSDSKGTFVNFEALSDAISEMRTEGSLSSAWRKQIDEDFKKRK